MMFMSKKYSKFFLSIMLVLSLIALPLCVSAMADDISDNDIIFVDDDYRLVLRGDPNIDDEINMLDVVITQKHIAQLSVLKGLAEKAADANFDEIVNMEDVVMMQKYIAKLIDAFATLYVNELPSDVDSDDINSDSDVTDSDITTDTNSDTESTTDLPTTDTSPDTETEEDNMIDYGDLSSDNNSDLTTDTSSDTASDTTSDTTTDTSSDATTDTTTDTTSDTASDTSTESDNTDTSTVIYVTNDIGWDDVYIILYSDNGIITPESGIKMTAVDSGDNLYMLNIDNYPDCKYLVFSNSKGQMTSSDTKYIIHLDKTSTQYKLSDYFDNTWDDTVYKPDLYHFTIENK